MGANTSSFLVSVAATIAAALIIWAANSVRKMARTVGQSTATVTTLAAAVTTLNNHDGENRERIAALWARTFPYPPPTNWGPTEWPMTQHQSPPPPIPPTE